MLTMLLCGLWHGASWNFVFWGGLHGVCLAIHRVWKAWDPLRSLMDQPLFNAAWNLFSRALTLGVVLVGWIFFRAQSWTAAVEYLGRLLSWSSEGTRLLSPYILTAVAAVLFVHLLVRKDRNWSQEIPHGTVLARVAAYSALALLISCLGATDSAPFIYFQF
jgi:alginate O-acetyltransferase complex protein AlgI